MKPAGISKTGRLLALLAVLFLGRNAAAAEEGILIDGAVLDSEGRPLSGARVELRPIPTRYEAGRREMEGLGPEVAARAATGPGGRFELTAPGPGMWTVAVEADGYVPMERRLAPLISRTALLPVELAPDAGLRVRVLDAQGRPVPGATVRAEARDRFPHPGRGGWTSSGRRGRTGPDGVARLPRAVTESLRPAALAPGQPAGSGPESGGRPAVLRLVPGTRRTLEVRGPRGGAAAGAIVRDLQSGFVLGQTDKEGRLAADLPADGEAGVLVETADGRNVPFRWRPTGDPVRVLQLPAPFSLSGRVVDRATRRPLPGAWIWPESDPARAVRADETGAFRLQTAGDAVLAAASGEHLPASLAARGTAPVVLALVPAPVLAGTVRTEDGRPVPGAEIHISRQDPTDEWTAREDAHRGWTSEDGSFRILGPGPGRSYAVRVELPGFAPVTQAVSLPRDGAAPPPLRLVLARGRTATGRVADSQGRPVAGARVELVPAPARKLASRPPHRAYRTATGPDGRFALQDLPAGWFEVRVESPGFAPLERAAVELPAGRGPADLGRFLLERGAAVTGQVLDPEDRPLAGAEVWAVPTPVRDWVGFYSKGPTTTTGPDGRFTLRDLPRGATFTLDICRKGFLPVTVTVREISPEPVRATLRPGGRLAGRVLSPGGDPVAGARLQAWRSGESPEGPLSYRPCLRGVGRVESDAEGRFAFETLPHGWWTVRAESGRHLTAERNRLRLEAGDRLEGVEIVLGEGAALAGRVLDASGAPAAGVRVQAYGDRSSPETVTAGDGTYRLQGVETGNRTVEATAADGAWTSRSAVVEPGENLLDLRLDPDGRQEIRGRVIAPDGSPVAGASVAARSSSSVYTGADGGFVLLESKGTYELWATREGYAAARAPEPVRVEDGPVTGIEIRLAEPGAIAGRLLGLDPGDLGTATVEVEGSLSAGFVLPGGAYRVSDLPPGEWEVTARAGSRTVKDRVTLRPGDAEAVLDLTFPATQEISGWVYGPDGQPVREAMVRVGGAGSQGAWIYSRSDGSFEAEVEDGTYRVWAFKQGYLRGMLEEPVTVEGAPATGLEIRLGEAAAVRGRILGIEPWERVREVWATDENGGITQAQIDIDGDFRLPSLTPGRWKVTAKYEGREATVQVQAEAGQETVVDLDLEEALRAQ